jgi:hypothetical protein
MNVAELEVLASKYKKKFGWNTKITIYTDNSFIPDEDIELVPKIENKKVILVVNKRVKYSKNIKLGRI